VEGAPGLTARQMDAASAFERMQTRYRDRIDSIFDAFVGSGVNVSHDRAILRDLLSLAPPGIDEVYALATLGETLAEERFDTMIVDPAPTGHLLRLLEMPTLALDWSHRLMRLMLKYKEVGGLGDAAEDLLGFARRTRALGELLADPARSGLLAVALDEPLVRAETVRLVDMVRSRGVDVVGVLWNRVSHAPEPLPVSPAVPQFVAPALEPPPCGVAALGRWRAQWGSLLTEHG
jgi:arsenite-transporting ATPase